MSKPVRLSGHAYSQLARRGVSEKEVIEAVVRLARQAGRKPPPPPPTEAEPVGWWRLEPGSTKRAGRPSRSAPRPSPGTNAISSA